MPSGMNIWVRTRSTLSEIVRHAAMSRIKGGAPSTPQSTAPDNREAGVGFWPLPWEKRLNDAFPTQFYFQMDQTTLV